MVNAATPSIVITSHRSAVDLTRGCATGPDKSPSGDESTSAGRARDRRHPRVIPFG
jgi:hypothetical protein